MTMVRKIWDAIFAAGLIAGAVIAFLCVVLACLLAQWPFWVGMAVMLALVLVVG